MLLPLICWMSTLASGPLILTPSFVTAVQWIGLTPKQIEVKLGEGPIATTFAGGSENLQVSCYYANAQLVVAYKDGRAVRTFRSK